ncbi:MAG: hypothetical protein R3E39_19895 [Anaerolineae bacterium]
MATVTYALEHFYYGQLANRPDSEPQMLAASQGVVPEQVDEAIKYASIPPMTDSPIGSWALVRGRQNTPFVLVQAQADPTGLLTHHVVIMPTDVLRALGGNLKAMLRLLEKQMPSYDKPNQKLKQLLFEQPVPISSEAQIDDILDLMSYTHNQIDIIEALLSGIVQGVPLVVQGAPPDVETRIKFVQGLLALLPASARFGVTFSTHTLETTQVDTQIRFFGGEKLSRQTLVYGWQKGKLGGNVVADDYSHFIASQLRLDAELVSQQTLGMTGVAAWRIKRGEGLAEALAYASYRFKLDNALQNNQPVETADVSRVLAEDPTLTDELKIAYTHHLLAFALALGDMQHADPIAPMLRQKPELEQAIQQQFDDAINDGKSQLVFDALARWMANPLGPTGKQWIELTHRAVLARMQTLVQSRDLKGMNQFLEQLHLASPGLEISKIVPRLIEMALPLSVRDRDLNLTVFLLAVNYLESDVLRRLISAQKFTAQLPPTLSRLAPYLIGEDKGTAPAGLLLSAASDFGEEWRDPILIRLAESAIRARRPDIVDTQALGGLVGVIGTSWGLQYSQSILWIANSLSSDQNLEKLELPGPTYLLKLLLGSGGHKDLAAEMLHQARVLYPGEAQADYIANVQRVFAETPIPLPQVPPLVKALTENGIKSLPLLMAYIGILEAQSWSPKLNRLAEESSAMLFGNPEIANVIPAGAMSALLRYYITRKDTEHTIRLAAVLPQVAVREGVRGINLIGRTYKLLDWDDKVRMAGLELLRRYVRQAPDADARKAVTAFGREFGERIMEAMEAAYAMRRLLGSVDLTEYADFLHVTAEYLYDTVLLYSDKNRIPTTGAIMNSLDSLGGGLTNADRVALADELNELGRYILIVGGAWQDHARDFDQHVDALLQHHKNPTNALDVLWIMGGYLSRGKRLPLKLQRVVNQHVFGERSAPRVLEDTRVVSAVLEGAVHGFPPNQPLNIGVEALRNELDSLWGDISLDKQREIVREFSTDLQRVGELVYLIAASGNAKAMETGSLARKLEEGSQQPKSTLELYRFVSGYFRARS